MTLLIVGLLLFLGLHSVRAWGEPFRTSARVRLGEGPWKGLYSLLSVLGLVLIVWGYGTLRLTPTVLWWPPVGARHGGTLLTFLAFVCMAAAYLPPTHLKARLGHPMVFGTGLWALGHLLANGTVADLLLFGSFLAWSVVLFVSSRRRDAVEGRPSPQPRGFGMDLVAGGVGVGFGAVFAFVLHARLLGVAPFG